MIVHPNPMRKTKEDHWVDSLYGAVEVRPLFVNWGNHRKRWAVYARRMTSGPMMFTSRHITEEQAVVTAQTLANRKKRLKDKNKRKRVKKVQIDHRELASNLNQLSIIVQAERAGSDHQEQQKIARETVQQLRDYFQL